LVFLVILTDQISEEAADEEDGDGASDADALVGGDLDAGDDEERAADANVGDALCGVGDHGADAEGDEQRAEDDEASDREVAQQEWLVPALVEGEECELGEGGGDEEEVEDVGVDVVIPSAGGGELWGEQEE
jgi:hypothetical protein